MTEKEIKIKNTLSDLMTVATLTAEFADPLDMPPKTRFTLDLILEEILTNIVKYAYEDTESHEISVLLKADEGKLFIRIEDDGKEFDPLQAEKAKLHEDISERKVGGLGIHLVKEMAGDVSYTRNGNINTLNIELAL